MFPTWVWTVLGDMSGSAGAALTLDGFFGWPLQAIAR
jgi:hypothetical protein